LADVGEGLHEAEIKRWLVRAGERVSLDQPLVEVETDKAVVELPAPVAGTVARLGAEEGTILHVGELVALIDVGQGNGSAPAQPAAEAAVAEAGSGVVPAGARRALATPAVRKRARELDVDLNAVPGSGPGGRVLAGDVEAFARGPTADQRSAPTAAAGSAVRAAPPPWATTTSATGERVPLRGLRRRIAQTMTQAWTTIPHITGFDEVEVSGLVATRERLKAAAEARGARLTYLTFAIKAAALALRERPIVNASLDEAAQEIVFHPTATIGIATATAEGLIVPVLRNAGAMTLIEIQLEADRLSARARERTITLEELHGGTFTITNFGALGGWQAAPIIRPGEAAVLGIGRVQERPWVVDGAVVPRPVMALSLAADHRLIDGDVSTAFLARVGSLLSHPELMLLDTA
jgi:pyruvate dehydrogenase E2 component (dihydrolipoamide acetyltransferase)